MAVYDPMVMPLAREMLACLDIEIMKVENPPLYVQLRPGGQVAHLLSSIGDDECCQGLAWVRPSSFFPSSGPFPDQDPAPVNGTYAWAITLELGAIRCAPTPDHTEIPTGEQWDATLQAVMDDAAAMRRALCCFIDARPNRKKTVLPGVWEPLDIQGGCVGGILPVTIKGPVCDCAEAGPES